jgi:hypothetical protein
LLRLRQVLRRLLQLMAALRGCPSPRPMGVCLGRQRRASLVVASGAVFPRLRASPRVLSLGWRFVRRCPAGLAPVLGWACQTEPRLLVFCMRAGRRRCHGQRAVRPAEQLVRRCPSMALVACRLCLLLCRVGVLLRHCPHLFRRCPPMLVVRRLFLLLYRVGVLLHHRPHLYRRWLLRLCLGQSLHRHCCPRRWRSLFRVMLGVTQH